MIQPGVAGALTCPPKTGPDPMRGSGLGGGSRPGAEAVHGRADHRETAGGGGGPGAGRECGQSGTAARRRRADRLDRGRREDGGLRAGSGEAAQGAGAGERPAASGWWPIRRWTTPSSKRWRRETSEPGAPAAGGCARANRAGRLGASGLRVPSPSRAARSGTPCRCPRTSRL